MSPAEAASRLLMVGAGNMGGAMLRRWLETGLPPATVTVVSPSGRAMPDGVRVVTAVPVAEAFDTVLLALKPQQLLSVSDAVGALSPRLLVSILAGVELTTLSRLTRAPVVRAMPNLPVSIGEGVVALHGSAGGEAGVRAEALMAPLGLVEWVRDETLFDLITALAGSGPAFVYRFIDALARAGVERGMPQDQAMTAALQAVGAAAHQASPVAGQGVPDELAHLTADILQAARQRGAEMAAAARGAGPTA